MLSELYIEALLVEEELADQVWELWDAGVITDELAEWAWSAIFDIQKCGMRPAIIYFYSYIVGILVFRRE